MQWAVLFSTSTLGWVWSVGREPSADKREREVRGS